MRFFAEEKAKRKASWFSQRKYQVTLAIAALLTALLAPAFFALHRAETRMHEGAAQVVQRPQAQQQGSVQEEVGAEAAQQPAQPGEIPQASVPIYRVEPISEEVVNILLLGTDSRAVRGASVGGNADTIILASYNRAAHSVTLVSFMRDTVLPINDVYGKLKTAYRTGGAGLIINTLNEFFALDIQGYVAIGLDGFATFVDETLGGLDIELNQQEIADINRRITDYQNEIPLIRNSPLVNSPPGLVHLSGAQTLAFVRNRSTPADGLAGEGSDYDRASRQQEVLKIMYEQLVAQNPVAAAPGLIAFAMKHVETNLSAEALCRLAEPLMTESIQINSISVPFAGTWEYGGDGSGILFEKAETAERLHAQLYEGAA